MLVDEIDKLNQQLEPPDKKQYLIADIVYEHDMYYIAKIGHNYFHVIKADDVIVHDYDK